MVHRREPVAGAESWSHLRENDQAIVKMKVDVESVPRCTGRVESIKDPTAREKGYCTQRKAHKFLAVTFVRLARKQAQETHQTR